MDEGLQFVESAKLRLGLERFFLPEGWQIPRLTRSVLPRSLSQLDWLPKLTVAVPPTRTVVIGSGTSSLAVCQALLINGKRPVAFLGVADNGGVSARVREVLWSPTLGDHRNLLLAVSPESPLKEYLRTRLDRFSGGRLAGLRVADLVLEALAYVYRLDYSRALVVLGELLRSPVVVLPVSHFYCDIVAQAADGRLIIGEKEIILRGIRNAPPEELPPLTRVELRPPVKSSPWAQEAIQGAKIIFLAPGDFYAGLLPALLPRGIIYAIAKAQAKGATVVQIIPGCNRPGQTDHWKVSDYVDQLGNLTNIVPDRVLANGETERLSREGIDFPVVAFVSGKTVVRDLNPAIRLKRAANQRLAYYGVAKLAEALRSFH